MRRRAPATDLGLVTAALLGGSLLVACANTASDAEEAANERASRQITSDLDETGDFETVEVDYNDDATNTAVVGINFTCKRCDVESVGAAAIGEVWASEITPLSAITVFSDRLDGKGLQTERYLLPDDEDELNERFGPRPVESLPDS